MTEYQQPSAPLPPQNHPQAITVLVLGICSLVLCQVLGPFAWSMGNKAVREIDASGGRVAGRDLANVGRILGIVATVLLVLGVLLVVVVFVFGAALGLGSESS